MIVLNIFYLPYKSEHIRPANILKHNSTRESDASFFNDYRKRKMALPCCN